MPDLDEPKDPLPVNLTRGGLAMGLPFLLVTAMAIFSWVDEGTMTLSYMIGPLGAWAAATAVMILIPRFRSGSFPEGTLMTMSRCDCGHNNFILSNKCFNCRASTSLGHRPTFYTILSGLFVFICVMLVLS
jgi:hypothetical protein